MEPSVDEGMSINFEKSEHKDLPLNTSKKQIREDAVRTAIHFLSNVKVKDSPLARKIAFLESKGLTSDEDRTCISTSGVLCFRGNENALTS